MEHERLWLSVTIVALTQTRRTCVCALHFQISLNF